ncbi:MAG: DNA polymerase III subunit beta [Planctomycetes bacterium]|nr:DNA polymerase III subunit beta [Planctomycetota bacterium]
MRVTADWESLRDALQVILHLIPGKASQGEPTLIHLNASDDALELFASDYDSIVQLRIDQAVDIRRPGQLCVPGPMLFQFVRDLDAKTLTIEAGGSEKCKVHAGGDSLELVAFDLESYESVPPFDAKHAITLQGDLFARLVERTIFATSKEERRGLHGARLEIRGEVLRMVATDTRRLAISEAPIESGPEHIDPVVIHPRTLGQIASTVKGSTESLRIMLLSSQIVFQFGGMTILNRVLQAKFPENYESIVPKNTPNSVRFSPKELASKLRLVSHMSAVDLRAVEFQLNSSTLTLKAVTPGQGEATAELSVQYDGTVDRLKYNPDYLVEALKRAEYEEVALKFEQSSTPGIMQLGEDFTYVVMPINL